MTDPKEKAKEHGFRFFLSTPGGAAIITAIIAGLLGNMIACQVQRSAKEREFRHTWLQARANQALLVHQKFLENQLSTIRECFQLVGKIMSASENLIVITQPEFDATSLTTKRKGELEKQIQHLRDQFNQAELEWRANRESIGFVMSYYLHGKPDVLNLYQKLQTTTDRYISCARLWHLQHPPPSDTKNACFAEKAQYSDSVIQFSKSLEKDPEYVLKGWETPEQVLNLFER